MKRTIIFGDIHGCFDEWEMLLKKVNATSQDHLIAVGDLIFKGPSSKRVLEKAYGMPNLQCIIGNHELRLLKSWKERKLEQLHKPYQTDFLKEMKDSLDKFAKWLDTWPYFIDTPDYLVIHAGLRPNIPLKKQDPFDLTHLRKLEPEDKPWYEFYKEKKLIIHGHWAAQGLVVRDNVIGLDSGCVYGKQLSCVILPERQIVQVNAKRVYQPID